MSKRLVCGLALGLVLSFGGACDDDDDVMTPRWAPPTDRWAAPATGRSPTAVRSGDGAPAGDGASGSASASLSAAGGRLVSADGKVILEIPRGALTRPSEVAHQDGDRPGAGRDRCQLRDLAGGRGAGQAGAAQLPLHRGRAGRQPAGRPAGGALRRRALERGHGRRQRRAESRVRRHQPLRNVRDAAGGVWPLSRRLYRRQLQVRRPRQPRRPGGGQVRGPGQRLSGVRARV